MGKTLKTWIKKSKLLWNLLKIDGRQRRKGEKMRGGEGHNVNKKRGETKEVAVMKTLLSGIHLSVECIVQLVSLSFSLEK